MGALRAHGLKNLRPRIVLPFTLLVIAAVLVPGLIAVHEGVKTLAAEAEEAQLLAARLAAYAPVEPSGWGVIVQQSQAAATARAITLRRFLLTVALVDVVIACLLGILLFRWISAPLGADEANLANGNLEGRFRLRPRRNRPAGRNPR